MRRYTIEAVVIKSQNFKDSDKILTLFTKKRGKITAFAKGIRKISSRRAGNLDTLNHIKAEISESKDGYKDINEVETIYSFKQLKKNLKVLAKAYYILELVYRFLGEEQENEKVFDLLNLSLFELEEGKNPEIAENIFEILFLKYIGYGLSFNKCVFCNKTFSDKWKEVRFNYALGGFVCDLCGNKGFLIPNDVGRYLHMIDKKDYPDFYDPKAVEEAGELLKNFIRDVLEGSLKSVYVFGKF